MAAIATASEEALRTLKCKTWVLKVSIHCEGCKRKVKKSLQRLEGVYRISVDSQQHKVTVTGNINSDTLLNKLSRIGKHAEIIQENSPAKPNHEKTEKQNILRTKTGAAANNNGNGAQRTTHSNNAAQVSNNSSNKLKSSAKNGNPDGKTFGKINRDPNATAGGSKRKGQKGNFRNEGNGALSSTGSMSLQQGTIQGVDWKDLSPTGKQSPITVPDQTAAECASSMESVLSYNSAHLGRGRVLDLYHQYIPSQPSIYTDAGLPETFQGQSVQLQGREERANALHSFDIFSEENATGCSIM